MLESLPKFWAGARFKLSAAYYVKGDDSDPDSLQVSLPYPDAGLAQQGDQLNMAVFFCCLLKMTCKVYVTIYVYTGQVTF